MRDGTRGSVIALEVGESLEEICAGLSRLHQDVDPLRRGKEDRFRIAFSRAGRLENGSDADKEKARALRNALKLASDQGVEGKFDALVRGLTTKGADRDIDVLAQVLKDNAELRKDLQRILALLTRDVYVVSGYISGTALAIVPLLFTVVGAVTTGGRSAKTKMFVVADPESALEAVNVTE